MASKLKEYLPLTVTINDKPVSSPAPQVIENLVSLHTILELVVEDWHRAVSEYELKMQSEGASTLYTNLNGLIQLKSVFLKCLFSYTLFFVSSKQGYNHLYSQLDKINKIYHIAHDKRPKESSLIKKAIDIRNKSIAHFPSKKGKDIDSYSAMSWTPLSLKRTNSPFSLKNLTFGGFKINKYDDYGNKISSQDLEVSGLEDLHKECLTFLENYDKVCYDYWNALRNVIN